MNNFSSKENVSLPWPFECNYLFSYPKVRERRTLTKVITLNRSARNARAGWKESREIAADEETATMCCGGGRRLVTKYFN